MKKRKERKGQVKRQKGKGKRKEIQEKGRAQASVAAERRPGVPPPESEIWPEEYRGKRWKPIYAKRFAGRCQLCAYSCPLPKLRQLLDEYMGVPRLLLCTNHPAEPGELREVQPTGTCRNFKARCWKRRPSRPAPDSLNPPTCASCPGVRRIAVGQGLFATVDAADYKKLSKYKWYACRHGPTVYATCRDKGRVVYMHRMILRPRKGYVVDHIDGNGLNNRRGNLRVCTHQQNQANRGPCGGSSRFVGVYRKGDQWVAEIRCRGEYFYLGLFDDEVEAAKARDRKAYELHGPYAYLNFPEDFRR